MPSVRQPSMNATVPTGGFVYFARRRAAFKTGLARGRRAGDGTTSTARQCNPTGG